MHPPFYVVDHRIHPQSHYPLDERRIVRRSQPEVLQLSLPGPGAPLVSYHPVAQPLPRQPAAPLIPNRARRLRDLFIFWRPA